MPSTLFALKRSTAFALVAILFVATFSFGGADPWALAGIAGGVFVLSAWWAIRLFLRPFRVAMTWFYLPLAIVPAVAAAQLAFGRTASRYQTTTEVAWWLVYFVFFALFVNVLDDVWLRRSVLRRLAYLGGAVSAVAIIQRLLSPHAAYGFRVAPGARIFGPFSDAESFAFLIELLFPSALFLAFRDGRRKLPLLSSCTLMVAAIALSGSTVGQVVVALELVVTLVASIYVSARSFSRRTWGPQAALTAVGAFAIIVVTVVGFGGFGDAPPRSLGFDPAETPEAVTLTRHEVLATSWELFRREPALGSGLGAFADAFVAAAPRRDGFYWEHSYSAPVELLVEVGAASAIVQAMLLGLILGARRDIRTWVSVILPLAAVWAHSWVRNPLHTPALVLTALTLLALLAAARGSSDRSLAASGVAD